VNADSSFETMNSANHSPILLARTDRIGDVVLSTSCLDPLRATFPDREIDFYVQPPLADLLQADPVATVVSCSNPRSGKGFSPARVLQWREFFRRRNYGLALFLQPDNDLQLAAVLARIPIRIGYRIQWTRWALNRTIPYRRHRGEKHETDYNFELLSQAGCQVGDPPLPRVVETVKMRAKSQALTKECPYVVFHPTAFGAKPTWPMHHFQKLAGELADRYSWDIRLIGDQPMPTLQKKLQSQVGGKVTVIDHGGRTDLQELAGLLKAARVVVGRDSGPSHLASSLAVPVVCLMGQCDPVHSPARWKPLGVQSRTLVCDLPALPGESRQDRWKRCFEQISPQQVLRAIDEIQTG